VYKYGTDDLTVTWTMDPGEGDTLVHSQKETMNVGEIIEEIMLNDTNKSISLKRTILN